MKNRLKVFLLLITALVIGSFISAHIMAQPIGKASVTSKSKSICYQFIAEDENDKVDDCVESSSTWLIESPITPPEEDPCGGIKVYAEYGPKDTCEGAKGDEPVEPLEVDKLAKLNLELPQFGGSKPKYLREIVAADTECGVIWLRFADKKNCKNIRCYIRGGRAYCR